MTQPKCPRCLQLLGLDDTLVFDGDQFYHLDCARPRDLSPEERVVLFRYCFDHAVAACGKCGQDFRQAELAADLFSSRTNLCPRCRVDLTERLREHVYNCALLPSEVRRRAREARAAAKRLVKESQQVSDRADVLAREAEATLAANRPLMRDARVTLAALRETMVRSAKAQALVGMPDEPQLREQAGEAIRSGKLPARAPDRNFVRHGRSGASCPVCGELVKRDQEELEIHFSRQGLGWDSYHLHPRCFAAWEFERTKAGRTATA
jgi:hypothetical protein